MVSHRSVQLVGERGILHMRSVLANLSSYCFIIVCAGALYFVLWSANKKKERIEYNEAEKDKLAFQDLTDKENPYFRYVL